MSDPYNQYPSQYGQGYPQEQYNQGYNQGYPQQQYPPQGHSPYPPQGQGYAPPPAPSYGEQQYGQQYGPPAEGGFQHGQMVPQGGDYNQRSTDQYYGAQQQFPQQGAYSQNPPPADPNNPYTSQQQYGAVDPAQGAEGERGIMGGIAGAVGGHYAGGKMGHGIIGTIAGAYLGSKAEDKLKESRHEHNQQSQYGGSQYGGGSSGGHHHNKHHHHHHGN